MRAPLDRPFAKRYIPRFHGCRFLVFAPCEPLISSSDSSMESLMTHRPVILLRGIVLLAGIVVLPACSMNRPSAEGGQPAAPERVIPAADDYKPFYAVNPKNPKVFFEITLDGKAAGRIEMELFADTCPRTAENFLQLCVGTKSKTGKTLA